MENFELNKIIGAVLGSLLFVMGLGFVADYLYAPDKLEQQAYVVEVEMSDDNHGGESVHVEEKVSLAMILAGGDAEKGRRSAKKCASCHTFDSGGANKVGPNLYGIVGRGKGEVDGFAYSKALAARTGETWTYEDLDAFIGAPKSWLPGTKMAFSGIKKPIDRGNIITYLRTLSPNAPDELEQQAYEVEVEMSDDNHGGESVHVEKKVSLATILAGGDAEKGRLSAKKCASCHTFDSGGANKMGPNLYGIVGRGKGEVDGFAYSKALAARTGETWTYEDLDAFIGAPKSWLPGTKMPFSGIKVPIDRGNIIAYLRTLSPNAPALPEPEK